jgi:hypothetical protein
MVSKATQPLAQGKHAQALVLSQFSFKAI